MKNELYEKIGISITPCSSDAASCISSLSEYGFRKYELPARELLCDTADKIVGVLQQTESECVSVSAVSDLVPVSFGNLTSLDRDEHKRTLTFLESAIIHAQSLGAKRFVIDAGTTVEDMVLISSVSLQNELLQERLQPVIQKTKDCGLELILNPVPGRKWTATESYPPDRSRVVERNVWPWRSWIEPEQIIDGLSDLNIKWAFDSANSVVAAGTRCGTLADEANNFIDSGLGMVYLANHPGPYNKVWHRLLMHQRLRTGWWSREQFLQLIESTGKTNTDVFLCIKEREFSPDAYVDSRDFLCG